MVASCVVEKDRLRQALERALPDTAFPFYVEIVRARIDDGASAPAANKDHWLSDRRWAVQKWLRIADVGRRFEPGIQAIYDALLDEQGHAVAEREEQRRTVEEDDRREAQAIRKSAAPARISEEEGRPAEAEAKAALLDATIPIADPKPAVALADGFIDSKTSERSEWPSVPIFEMHPAMAAAVRDELRRQARFDAELRQREADRAEYEHQLRTR